LYLDIEGGNRGPGTRVIVWNKKPQDNDNQQWYSDPPSGTIRSKLHDFCLTAEGSLVVKPFQPGDPNQQLEWADAIIRNKQMPNRVLDSAGGGPGTPLSLRDYNGSPPQMFEFELVGAGGGGGGYPQAGGYPSAGGPRRMFLIVSKMNGKVLDIKGANAGAETQVVMWPKTGNKNQQWYADEQGNIRSALNEFAFIANRGENIKMRPSSGAPQHQWYLDGTKISNRSGDCLDIRGSSGHDGADVLAYQSTGQPNQQWTFEYI